MRDPEKIKIEKEARNNQILNAALELFLTGKIEGTSMEDIAKTAEVGRVTLYRYYSSKGEVAVALWKREWSKLVEELGFNRPIESGVSLSAADTLRFVLEMYIEVYHKHKEIFLLYDNINHYIAHEKDITEDEMISFADTLKPVYAAFSTIYKKANECDHSLRSDIPEEEFFRLTVGTMQSSCSHYADDFEWGKKGNRDYTAELMLLEEMIMEYSSCCA